jgi:hypothetical protein
MSKSKSLKSLKIKKGTQPELVGLVKSNPELLFSLKKITEDLAIASIEANFASIVWFDVPTHAMWVECVNACKANSKNWLEFSSQITPLFGVMGGKMTIDIQMAISAMIAEIASNQIKTAMEKSK